MRREKPILDKPIKCSIKGDFLVVDKPSSIPCHSTNSYFHNSLINELNQKGFDKLHLLNRIDRTASGLVLFAVNRKGLELFNKSKIRKTYLVRVKGQFEKDCEVNIGILKKKGCLHEASIDGKASTTIFRHVSYDAKSNTSLVEAHPITGRTHQIRVHLQYLGFSIANDILYGGQKLNEPVSIDRSLVPNFENIDGEVDFFQIWLHSCKYEFAGLEFEVDKPNWTDGVIACNNI